MIWLLLFALWLRVHLPTGDATFLTRVAQSFHNSCLALAPRVESSIHKALVCGEALPPGPTLFALQASGLIHIVVVSGSHLIVLLTLFDYCTQKSRSLRKLSPALLLLFTFVCSLQPPVVRSLVQMSLHLGSRKGHFHWSSSQTVLYSGLICLIAVPQWLLSHSLLLSWGASLALSLLHRLRLNLFVQQTVIWLVMAPLLLPLAAPSAIGIFTNTLLAPLIGGLLFPLSLCCFICPLITPLFSALWHLLINILSLLPSELGSPQTIARLTLWVYLLSLHCILQLRRVRA